MKTSQYIILCLFLMLHSLCYGQQAYTIETVPNDHLKDANDYVTNPAQIISSQAEAEVNTLITDIEATSTAEVAVVLLPSIGNADIDDFATRLFTQWGIGKNNDNGLLYLLVYDQSQMVFRTGYGLEGVLPDIILSRIIRNEIVPQFRSGDFDAGVLAGIRSVQEYLNNPETVAEIMQSEKDRKAQEEARAAEARKRLLQGYLLLSFLVFLGFLTFYLTQINGKRLNYEKYDSLQKGKIALLFACIFFPVFLILLAVFYFKSMRNLREKAPQCPECGGEMRKLSEQEEDKYLSPQQIAEENVRSVDYDVWVCPNNDHQVEIFPYTNLQTTYTACPHCHAKTYGLLNDLVLQKATTMRQGKGERIYTCRNCGFKNVIPYIIPMIIVANSGRRGNSGGFGGGGGSWGGGSTGGGGARGGW